MLPRRIIFAPIAHLLMPLTLLRSLSTRSLNVLFELRLRRQVKMGRSVVVLGPVRIRNQGKIKLGDHVRLEALQAPIDLYAGPGAELVIEDDVVIESGCSIEATGSVLVGRGARLGAFSKIIDNHFHQLQGDRNEQPPAVPVIIGAGATLGPMTVVLPGAAVGKGARVGAGAVFARRIPDRAEVHGFPLLPKRAAR
jgi:acetyltransferase-like isoleucine patch superfamily enzyme